MTDQAIREAVARAICCPVKCAQGGVCSEPTWWMAEADAAIAAHIAALEAAGYTIVPPPIGKVS